MALVMLSRATRAIDVHIVGEFNKESIKCDTKFALPESERLLRIFDERESTEKKANKDLMKISYLNVKSIQSWDGHRKDIIHDDFLMRADILGFGETWLYPDQTLELEGYQGYFSNIGRGKGVAAFSKMQLTSKPIEVSTEQYSAVLLETHNFDIIYLYLSAGYNEQALFPLLDSWIRIDVPTVIMGDINEDFLKGKSKMKNFLSPRGFSQLIQQPTFDRGSLIDHTAVIITLHTFPVL